MPQLVLFNRKWNIGSDDFVFAETVDFIVRVVWAVVVIVIYSSYNDEIDCSYGTLLHVYFIGLIVFLAITAVLAAMIVYTSMQGSIAQSYPRRRLHIWLYIRIFVGLPEVVWNALGTHWAFSKSSGCHKEIVRIARGTVIGGWVIVFIVILTFVISFNVYNGKKKRSPTRVHSFKRGSRRPHSQAKNWEKRCKCMFMCANGDDRSTSVYTTLAQLSADYFKVGDQCIGANLNVVFNPYATTGYYCQPSANSVDPDQTASNSPSNQGPHCSLLGVDLVPTDVVAGLILLSRKHERRRQRLTLVVPDDPRGKRPTSDVTDGPDVILECVPVPKDWMTLDLMSRYLRFALGSYGWPFYVTLTKPIIGVCCLCTKYRCCSCRDTQGQVFMDNCCLCNTAAFKKTTGVHHEDIVYASFKNEIYEIPFYVVIDRKMNAVVVAIRGTLSLQDVMTDLVIERGDVSIDGIPKAFAHNGILQSALYIKRTLEDKNILKDAFSRLEEPDLVITGHSLGAGAAGLLAILLKPTYPTLRCFAFSPPGELISPHLRTYSEDIICTVVLGDDLITRQGMLMMDDLKIQILEAIHRTKLPKYKILASGCWRMCCGRAGTMDEDMVRALQEVGDQGDTTDAAGGDTTDAAAGENNIRRPKSSMPKKTLGNRSSLEVSMTDCIQHSSHIKSTYQPLHLPGQILHVEQSTFSGDDQFHASWKGPANFTEIIVSPDMLAHHFPDALQEAIDGLINLKYDIMKSLDDAFLS